MKFAFSDKFTKQPSFLSLCNFAEKYGYDGYWYCSEPYVRLHTMFFTLNKEGMTNEMKTKLGL